MYRPGQPNWEFLEISGFFPTQILREINFGHFEGPKIAIYAV